jgi:hypothetical protein
MKVSEFLGEARDELNKGWTQRAYQNGDGEVCAIGAIERVAMRNLDTIQAAAEAQREIQSKAQEVYGKYVQAFNDASTTSKQDVLDLFDKAIAGLEERGE